MLRWGIVGYGWVARDYMAPGIAMAGDKVVAICDPNRSARAMAEAAGVLAFADLPAMLRVPLDAVYVATPNHRHREIAVACLDAGIPVLCEKPMAATVEDAEEMAAAAKRTGVLLGLAFDQRHHPAHSAIRKILRAGRIGTVTAIRIVYACWVGRDWGGQNFVADGTNWRIDAEQAGGGAVIDLAPHGIDLVDALLGEPVVALAGLLQSRVQDYPVDDGGMLVGRTESGVLVSLHNSYNMPENLPRRRLEIIGTGGQITALDTIGQTAGGTVSLLDAASGRETAIAFDTSGSPFVAQARAFAGAVRGGRHDFDSERDLGAMCLLASVLEIGIQRVPSLKAS